MKVGDRLDADQAAQRVLPPESVIFQISPLGTTFQIVIEKITSRTWMIGRENELRVCDAPHPYNSY